MLELLGQAVVRHLQIPIDIEQDVLGLEVAVHETELMEVIDGQEDLCCVELGPLFRELLALAEVGEHLPAPDEVHDEEDLFLGLEGVLEFDKEGVFGWVGEGVHFSRRKRSVFVLMRCSFSMRSSLRMLLMA